VSSPFYSEVNARDKMNIVQQAKTPFHIMVKPHGPICNLACGYCYYLHKENLFHQSDFKMSPELLAHFTHQVIAAQPGHQVTFTWQGGEPTLMGLEFYRKAVRLQKRQSTVDRLVKNVFQTNGVLLTPAWCRFFKENNFLVGLSLDGPVHLHNIYRKDKFGHESFDEVMRSVDLLKKFHVDFNILCCVHQGNVQHPLEVYSFLRDTIEAQFIQFIPVLQRGLNEDGCETQIITDCSVKGTAFGEFLKSIFDEWVQHDVGNVFVQHFDIALGAWSGQPSHLCVFSETCGRALVLEHNGDLFSCDHFVNIDHLLGNITETPLVELVESNQQRKFGEAKKAALPQSCLDCDYLFVCNGGCPKNRDEKGLNRLCDGYKAFFRHIGPAMSMMTDLLHQNRLPAEIMLQYPSND